MSEEQIFSSSVEKKIESDIVETKRLVLEEEWQLDRIKQLDAKIDAIHTSTQTLIPPLAPLHNYFRNRWRWYYNWHLNKNASSVHWTIVFAGILALMLFTFK